MPDLLVLHIEDIAFGGKGVARHDGQVIFVPFTVPGDTVTAQIVKQKKNFAEARAVKLMTPSSDRVDAPCPYFSGCGGCMYQHLRYDAQLAIKSKQVADALRRVAKLDDVPMRPIVGSTNTYGYRNRIRVHRSEGVTGFFTFESRRLIDVEQCILAQPDVNKALRKLRNSKVPDGDYSLRAPGGAGPFFEQTNEQVTRALVGMVDAALRRDQALLVDAYCGGGLFAKALVEHAEKIVGIETNAAAIKHARKDASTKENYVEGDVAAKLGDILAGHDAERTTVLLDPPSEGVNPAVTDILLAAKPSEIGYISCNPATLARDISRIKAGYRLESVTPLDMFPQTAEIEIFAHLVRA
ncbi:MAG: TRAM domain-containing protein [Chthoniobacteraceae bacterium]